MMATSKNGLATRLNSTFLILERDLPILHAQEIDEQPTVMRKLIQAYTDESGQVVVDPAIIKAVQEADRIYILAGWYLLPMLDFASKKNVWKS